MVDRALRILVLAAAAVAAACDATPENHGDRIAAWRADKDSFMRSSDSPVPADQRAGFPPLPYFPIDEQYNVPAALRVARSEQIIEMSTSTGNPRRMRRVGTLAFTLKGQPLTLTAFAEVNDTQLRRLFVPFGDLTNGVNTYQGGRYLDLELTASNVYELDFNRAYHPFCVFNPTYECPLPPRENRLAVPVQAGEKLAP